MSCEMSTVASPSWNRYYFVGGKYVFTNSHNRSSEIELYRMDFSPSPAPALTLHSKGVCVYWMLLALFLLPVLYSYFGYFLFQLALLNERRTFAKWDFFTLFTTENLPFARRWTVFNASTIADWKSQVRRERAQEFDGDDWNCYCGCFCRCVRHTPTPIHSRLSHTQKRTNRSIFNRDPTPQTAHIREISHK